MQVQVNTDNHIMATADLIQQVEASVESALGRFSERITRVEVHLTDESSSAKHYGNDKRCVLEARLSGMKPVSVSHDGTTIEQALDGAAERLQKLEDPKGRTSFGGDQKI
jgi:ribosome-associated translation inhibitor RaiA